MGQFPESSLTLHCTFYGYPQKTNIIFYPFCNAHRLRNDAALYYQNIDRSRFEVGVASFARGELLNELPPDVPVFIIPRVFTLWQKVQFHLGKNPILAALRKLARTFGADLWYVNTMMLPETVTVAKEHGISLLTHFHELPLTYSYLDAEEMKNVLTYSQTLLGCSRVTSEAISQAGGKNVRLLYSFINIKKLRPLPARAAQIRKELGIGPDDFVWIGSGMASERKGFDLLPDLAEALDNPNVHLVWVGGRIDNGMVYYTEQRCARSKSKTRVHLVGKQKEAYVDYLNAGNGFMLLSRQDPFPLVMIEAAQLGKPIVAFPSGGVSEFLQEGMGFITDDISVRQMVAAMRQLMAGQVAIDAAKSRERAAEFSVESGCRQWTALMNDIM